VNLPEPDPTLEAVKARHRLTWGLDVEAYARHSLPELGPVAERLVEFADPPWDGAVLDVATGPGTAALIAARRVGPGGRVVGIDLAPPMVAHAERAADKLGMAHASFVVGDAEELAGLADGSFDTVLSNFGAIFAPTPARFVAAAARVLRPGGRLAMSAWVRTGVGAELMDLAAGLMPPPPPAAARPEQWGDPGVAEERLAPHFEAIEVARVAVPADYPSVDQVWLRMKEGRPAFAMAYLRLDPAGKAAIEERARALFRRHADDSGRVRYERTAILARGTRRSAP
jgi:SAM-dependent methyltransferase